jgi:hypothetical protein
VLGRRDQFPAFGVLHRLDKVAPASSSRSSSPAAAVMGTAPDQISLHIPGLRVEHVDISDMPLLNTDLETPNGGSARRRGFPRLGPDRRLLPLRLPRVQLLHRKYVLPCSSPFSSFFLSCHPVLRDWLIDQRGGMRGVHPGAAHGARRNLRPARLHLVVKLVGSCLIPTMES